MRGKEGESPVSKAKLAPSSKNLLETKCRAVTKLDILEWGWGVGRHGWGSLFVKDCSYGSVPAFEPRELQKVPGTA